MVIVKFIKGVSPYQAGELAGFSENEAQRLIQAGAAEEYSKPEVKAETKPPVDKIVKEAPNKSISRTKK